MVKKFFKKQSKRMSCSLKYKIRHKVSEHNKKIKKIGNLKNKKQNKKKQQFNIPNSFPFKDQLLQQAIDIKAQKLLEKKQKVLDRRERKNTNNNPITKMEEDSLTYNFISKTHNNDTNVETNEENFSNANFKSFKGVLKQVISESNVILLVIDARDPLGTCCLDINKFIPQLQNLGKRLVLLLNKIDLVPHENAMAWVKHLRSFAPTIPFKASVQAQHNNLGTSGHTGSSSAFGREHLMKLLSNYCRSNHKTRSCITVGVIGMPNVGKSSVINSLKRKKVCEQGSVPGITKTLKKIKVYKNLFLLDSPGVIVNHTSTENSDEDENLCIAMKNVIRVDQIEDPVRAVDAMLQKCEKKEVMLRYKIPTFEGTDEFLLEMARKLGKLKKGGKPDIEETARHVIKDWNQGKIKYYTAVPQQSNKVGLDESLETVNHPSSEIVNQWSQEFDIDAILSEKPGESRGESEDEINTEEEME